MIRSAQRRASVTMTTLFLETNRISIPDAFMIPRLLIVKRKGTSWGRMIKQRAGFLFVRTEHSERTKLLPNPPHGSVLDSVGGVGF